MTSLREFLFPFTPTLQQTASGSQVRNITAGSVVTISDLAGKILRNLPVSSICDRS